MKVNLVERESNKLQKRVGFSFWYFFLGPIYLLVRLRWEAFLFILLYYYLLPVPGLDLFIKYLLSRGVNPQFIYNIEGFALFFKHDWMSFNNYLGVILFAILHIAMSFRCDNWLLSKKIKKRELFPERETDARILIYYRVIPYNALLGKDAFDKSDRHNQVEKIWEDKNIEYTRSVSQKEISDANFYNTKVKARNTIFHSKK